MVFLNPYDTLKLAMVVIRWPPPENFDAHKNVFSLVSRLYVDQPFEANCDFQLFEIHIFVI